MGIFLGRVFVAQIVIASCHGAQSSHVPCLPLCCHPSVDPSFPLSPLIPLLPPPSLPPSLPPSHQVTSGVTAVSEELKKYDSGRKFKYSELKGKQSPPGIDVTVKEVLL